MTIIKKLLVFKLKYNIFILIFFITSLSLNAQLAAELRIDITRGTIKPLAIAITNFVGKEKRVQQFGRDISMVISAISLIVPA